MEPSLAILDALTARGAPRPDPGVGGRGRVKLLPEGEAGVGRVSGLNHLRPEGRRNFIIIVTTSTSIIALSDITIVTIIISVVTILASVDSKLIRNLTASGQAWTIAILLYCSVFYLS